MKEKYGRHYEDSQIINASQEDIFSYVDDIHLFSSHMSRSSWMMGGGRMNIQLDASRGQRVGSHISLSGKVFGISLFLDEVITTYDRPSLKAWETVGIPKLLVIGSYQMGVEIKAKDNFSLLRVFIDYDLPKKNVWLGLLFGRMYAKWCVKQMIKGTRDHFSMQHK